MKPHFQMARGVTLLELLVVAAIIGILVIGINTSYKSYYTRVATRGFTSAVLTKVREAKNNANSLNKDVTMTIDLTEQKITNTFINDAGESVQIGTSLSPSFEGVALVFAKDRFDGQATITFTAHGTTNVGIENTQIHIGSKDDDYDSMVAATSTNFNTVVIFTTNGMVASFYKGCFANLTDAGNWPVCRAL